MKILLVDDDAFLRDMYAVKFTQAGHEVESVGSGAAALAKLEQGATYDVMLLDVVMPNMTGTELMKQCKQQYPDAHTVYIVLSNQGQDEDIKAANAAGAAGYIIKAESIPSEVVERVETLVSENA